MDKVANASKALSQLSLETDPIERLKLILQLNSSFIPEVPTSINNGLYNYMKSDDNNNTMKAEFDVAVMYDFLMDCAAQIGSGMLRLLESNLVGAHSDTPVLTFGWNRCTPTALNNTILKQIVGNIEVIRPPKQQQFYTKTWIEDQQQLFDHYFDIQYHQNNRSYPIADFLAFNASVQLATGKTACEVNTYSGAWFWFAVMSTVGYGNISIETVESRTLIYTMGLFSIVCFGGVLATAGYITLAIFDDAFIRLDMKFLTQHTIACLFWGMMYYGWMLWIMAHYKNWNTRRLGDDGNISIRDSYWFAFISTTTIGLGDFVLSPDVLLLEDIVLWPLNFLIGFVLLAAFLGKISVLILGPFQSHGIDLAERLAIEHPTANDSDETIQHNSSTRCEQDVDSFSHTDDHEGEGTVTVRIKSITKGYIDDNNVKAVSEEI